MKLQLQSVQEILKQNKAIGKSGLDNLTREQVMNLALALGKVLLLNGAETSRVEDSMSRFCWHYNYYDVNVFVTPTVIIVGDETTDGQTLICRIRWRNNNLTNVSQINEFCYNISCWPLGYEETMAYLNAKLEEKPPYNQLMVVLASGLGSASFAFMLGGNSFDFAGAFVVGSLSMWMLKRLSGVRLIAFWENMLAGSFIGVFGLLCCALSRQCTMENIVVGSLMPFLPGSTLTNGLRDFMAGDLLSGCCRTAEAMLCAVAVAMGLAVILIAWYYWGWNLWPLH